MLSKLLLLAVLSLSAGSIWAKELVIISDLDETLRIANVEKKVKAGLKLIKGVENYEGLTAIFQDLKQKNPDAKFYYLSNSFTFLYNGEKWVKENHLPAGVVYQRCLNKDKSDTFKPQKLKEIAAAHPDATFMLFGDNIEKDPKFYRDFVNESALSDAKIYIRDARLIFPQETDMTYFQTESQITDDLEISAEATALINKLSFSQLVPHFLMKNLHKRLVKECKNSAVDCQEVADARVQEVRDLLAPSSN